MTQKNYLSQGVTPPYRIVKFGTADKTIALSTAPTDLSIGVTGRYKGNAADGDRVDVIRDDFCEVEYGGTVTRGQALTSDSTGRAVAATPATLHQTVINGGAAGVLTLTGIATTDTLVSVIQLDVAVDTGTSASGNKLEAAVDLTSEFSISAANAITNAAGTNTTGDRLLVTYRKPPTRVIGYAEVSAVVGDIGWMMIGLSSI
jgi:hypothetical protein